MNQALKTSNLRNSMPNNMLPDTLVHGLHRRANTQDANVFHVLSDFKNTMGTFYTGYQIGIYQVAVILGNVKRKSRTWCKEFFSLVLPRYDWHLTMCLSLRYTAWWFDTYILLITTIHHLTLTTNFFSWWEQKQLI